MFSKGEKLGDILSNQVTFPGAEVPCGSSVMNEVAVYESVAPP